MSVGPYRPPEALVDALYDGIVEQPGWFSFLNLVRAEFRAEAASILIQSDSLGQPERLRILSPASDPRLADAIDAFVSGAVFPDHCDGNLHALSAQIDLKGAGRPGPTTLLGVAAKVAPGIAFAFGLWRSAPNPFAAPDRALIEALRPHLERAMRIFVRYAQAYRERAVYAAVVDSIGVGVALVDAKSAIMTTNAIAGEVLAERNGLGVAQGRLASASPEVTRALEAAVRRAAEAQTAPAPAAGQPMAIDRQDGAAPLTLMVLPGPSVRPLNAPLRRSAIVVLRDPERRAAVSSAMVAELFGLTPAEAALATHLAQGANLDEAAAELGIRRNTVRSQLQSIFMKTGAKRQSELVRLILSSVATLAR